MELGADWPSTESCLASPCSLDFSFCGYKDADCCIFDIPCMISPSLFRDEILHHYTQETASMVTIAITLSSFRIFPSTKNMLV